MVRTGAEAGAWAKAHTQWHPNGMCAQFTRSCFGVGALYGSARLQWLNAQHKHRTSDPLSIPAHVPVYWSGGSRGYGHVAFSVGGGLCRSTDWTSGGHVSVARISSIHAAWGHTLVGWAEDINRVRIWTPPKPGTSVHVGNLRPGKHNTDVADLQRALRSHGYAKLNPAGVTGYFGDETRTMVRAFQRGHGWTGADADGIPGPETCRKLGLRVI
jgi:hypothetical protein